MRKRAPLRTHEARRINSQVYDHISFSAPGNRSIVGLDVSTVTLTSLIEHKRWQEETETKKIDQPRHRRAKSDRTMLLLCRAAEAQ
jgi:hypothetical protein